MKLVEDTSIKCVPGVLDGVLDVNFPLNSRLRQQSAKRRNKVNFEKFKAWNPYVTVFITILYMIINMYSIIYK